MAVRKREGRRAPWQCYWTNPFTGKNESMSFLTEKEAKKQDSLIKHRLKFDRESFKAETQENVQKNSSGITLEQAYMIYLKQKNFSPKSIEWQMDAMRYPLKKLGKIPIAEIKRQDLEQIRAEMLTMPVKPVTTRGRLSVLRTVMRWGHEQGLRDAVDFPPLPSAQYERFIPPTPEELSRIIECAPPHIQRVVIPGSQTGIRVGKSELLKLTWADIDLDLRLIRIHGSKKNLNAPWREVPIRESLIPIFSQWYSEDKAGGCNFLINHNGKPVQSFKSAWKKTLQRAGITRRIRPYDLRHAFGTELVAAGVDIGTVAKLMGHSDPTMLLTHYQYVMDKQKRQAVESLPELKLFQKTCPKTCPNKKSTYGESVSA